MWRTWDMDSQEEQQVNNSASKGNRVLASDSDDRIVFVAKKPLPSIQQPWVVARAANDALPTFSSSASDTSSSLGEY